MYTRVGQYDYQFTAFALDTRVGRQLRRDLFRRVYQFNYDTILKGISLRPVCVDSAAVGYNVETTGLETYRGGRGRLPVLTSPPGRPFAAATLC